MGTASSVNRNAVKEFEKYEKMARKIKEDTEKATLGIDGKVTCLKQIETFLKGKVESEKCNIGVCILVNNKEG